MGTYWDNGNENGNYYLGFSVRDFPKIGSTFSGVLIIRTERCLGSISVFYMWKLP